MRAALLMIVLAWASVSAQAAPLLSIEPSSLSVGGGQTFTIQVSVADAVDLYAWQLDLGFDPTILNANSIDEGPFLATGGSTFFIPGTIDNTAGSISFTGNSLLTAISGVNGSGVLATVSFTAVGAGTSPVNLFNVELLDSSLSGTDTTVANGSVTTVVPEPTGLGFAGFGLVALALLWQRRNGTRPNSA